MDKLSTIARLSVATGLLALAACGGGGGGGAPATNIVSTPTSSGTPSTGSSGSTTDTSTSTGGNTASGGSTTPDPTSTGGGSSGGGTPAPFATFGTGTTDTNQFATFTSGSSVPVTASGTPTLIAPAAATKGTNPAPMPSGTTQPLTTSPTFPLTQTVIQIDASGIKPANQVVVSGRPSPLDGGATLTVNNWNPNGSSDFTLSIPGLGLVGANARTFSSTSLLKGASTFTGNGWRITATNNSYAALGLWEQDAASPNTVFLGTYITGYETPVTAMPTSGTASYFSTRNVAAIVSTFENGNLSRGSVLGDASFTADFGAGSLTGTFTNMVVITANGVNTSQPWNDISVSSAIAGNHFSGSVTAAAPSTAGPFTITGGTAGKIDGGFYGPNADQVAGVWSLIDSSHVVVGVAVGRQH